MWPAVPMITWRMPASPARVRHYTPAPRTKQAILWTFARVPLDGSTPSDLSSGRAEASEGDLPQIASFKLDEVQTHLIITDHLVQTGGMLINKPFFDRLSKPDQDLIVKAAKAKMKFGENALLLDRQRKGMQVVIPDAESFRVKAKPAIEDLFKKEWPVTTWAEVLAQ
jgi:TRAP-type C4-dicarboxylate transport system substrate-binding protein